MANSASYRADDCLFIEGKLRKCVAWFMLSVKTSCGQNDLSDGDAVTTVRYE
jgi:hypothetical protein